MKINRVVRWVLIVVAAVLLLGGGWWWRKGRRAEVNPQLTSPALAIAALPDGAVYFTPKARTYLIEKRPASVAEDLRDPLSPAGRALAQAVEDFSLFRQLDRERRFAAVLLAGSPTEYAGLLNHLLDSPDWTLAYLDHTALIFRRKGEAAEWRVEDLDKLRAGFSNASDAARALALAAEKVVAVRKREASWKVLEQAAALDSGVPEVWAGQAAWHLVRGELKEAEAKADKALALDPDHMAALGTKLQTLLAARKYLDARDISDRISRAFPNDPRLLFNHAKVCHEALDYRTEIVALHKLIELAEKAGQPAGGYLMYLAQAYANDGQAQAAVGAFQKVAADPELPKEQREFAKDKIKVILDRVQLNQPKR